MEEKQIKVDDLIAELNKVLIKDATSIEKLIKGYKQNPLASTSDISLEVFNKVVPFDKAPADVSDVHKALHAKCGVYIFLMTSDCNVSEKFNSVYYGAPLKDATISKFNAGNILYVGKAKSILSRMGQHFNVANENNHTGSLKILSSERKALIGHFTVYAFCIRPKYKAYYDLIAPTVERGLRGALKPLVGI